MDPWLFPQRNPILPWADIQCKVKWDRRAPKPHYRWSFPQINLHTVTTLNQYLHMFSKVFLIVRTMPRPTPMGIRHEVFALAREGIKQGAIAAHVGLTRATVNRILKRHAATGSLVPGKSSGAPRKTTPRQDCALLRMIRQDRFLSARALTARMRNLYGMRAGRTTVNNRLLSRGYRAYRPTTKPLLTANHRRLRLEWAQRWRNLTVAHWQHVIFGDESRKLLINKFSFICEGQSCRVRIIFHKYCCCTKCGDIITNLTPRNHWGYITGVSIYHNVGIRSMDWNIYFVLCSKTYSTSCNVL